MKTFLIGITLLFFICLFLFGCASRQPAVSQSQMDVFAQGCANGFVMSCIVLNQSYEQNRAQIVSDQQAYIADRVHWQNYWLAQQQSSDALYNDTTNQINFTRSQLMQH